MVYEVGYLVGSLATRSVNRKLAGALANAAPNDLVLHEIPIAQLPMYSWDFDEDFPEVGWQFKRDIEQCDALMIVTPEYNRSIPGSLKNAIDWGSRPKGKSSFTRKPVMIAGASPGGTGTGMAQAHLKNVVAFLDMPLMGQPEGYFTTAPDFFDADGNVADESTAAYLVSVMEAFAAHVKRVLG